MTILFCLAMILYSGLPLFAIICGMLVFFSNTRNLILYSLASGIYVIGFTKFVNYPIGTAFAIIFISWAFMAGASWLVLREVFLRGWKANMLYGWSVALGLLFATDYFISKLFILFQKEWIPEVSANTSFIDMTARMIPLFSFLFIALAFVIWFYIRAKLYAILVVYFMVIVPGLICTLFISCLFSKEYSNVIFLILLSFFFFAVPAISYFRVIKMQSIEAVQAAKFAFLPPGLFLVIMMF